MAIEDGAAGRKAIRQTFMFSVGIGVHPEVKQADWHVHRTEEITYEKLKKRFMNHSFKLLTY